jgi:hypothetical protein
MSAVANEGSAFRAGLAPHTGIAAAQFIAGRYQEAAVSAENGLLLTTLRYCGSLRLAMLLRDR